MLSKFMNTRKYMNFTFPNNLKLVCRRSIGQKSSWNCNLISIVILVTKYIFYIRVIFLTSFLSSFHYSITFSLYAEPRSWTDLRSTPFMPFLPSLDLRLRKHRRMQQKHIPSTTTPTPDDYQKIYRYNKINRDLHLLKIEEEIWWWLLPPMSCNHLYIEQECNMNHCRCLNMLPLLRTDVVASWVLYEPASKPIRYNEELGYVINRCNTSPILSYWINL